jgi:hypothetical protein
VTLTIYRKGPFRFFFYSHEPRESPHVHVERDDTIAKIWLHDGAIADSGDLPARDLQRVVAIVMTHQARFLEAWHEHFDSP